jgi:1-deoxy-D-xylulose-5-phosphate reductoisomerase
VPVDSEHSALAQCLRAGQAGEVARMVVTASGGPFRGRTTDDLAEVTVDEALAHPTWDMGPVITVNSASLANKGLEVIETHLLFDVPYDRIEVVVHPTSIVHSMVEFCDGAVLAALSPPDMRLPIQLALTWPERLMTAPARMDWTAVHELRFEPLDRKTFPMVDLAIAAGMEAGTAPAVYNAANEHAVAAFLDRRVRFVDIPRVVEAVLEEHDNTPVTHIDDVLAAERWARMHAGRVVAARQGM